MKPPKYFPQQKAGSSFERTMPKFANTVYKCLFSFKGEYAIEMNTLHWYGSWSIDTNLRSILLHCVYVFLLLFKVWCLYSETCLVLAAPITSERLMGIEEICYGIGVLYDQASHLAKKLFVLGQLDGMLYELAMQEPQKNNCY